jgi:hypothetical protein
LAQAHGWPATTVAGCAASDWQPHWQVAPGQSMQVQAEVVGKFMKVSLEVEEFGAGGSEA